MEGQDPNLIHRALMFATQAMGHIRYKNMEHRDLALAIEEVSRTFIVAYSAGHEDGLRFKRR